MQAFFTIAIPAVREMPFKTNPSWASAIQQWFEQIGKNRSET